MSFLVGKMKSTVLATFNDRQRNKFHKRCRDLTDLESIAFQCPRSSSRVSPRQAAMSHQSPITRIYHHGREKGRQHEVRRRISCVYSLSDFEMTESGLRFYF